MIDEYTPEWRTHTAAACQVDWGDSFDWRVVRLDGRRAVINDGRLEPWAKFVATDYGGDVHAFENEPVPTALHWDECGGLIEEIDPDFAAPGDWRDSLRSVLLEESE